MSAATLVSIALSIYTCEFPNFLIDSTALLIGEKAAVLTAEDLGYSGKDLDMKVSYTRLLPEFSTNNIGTKLSRSW